jgi:hypothetical protein
MALHPLGLALFGALLSKRRKETQQIDSEQGQRYESSEADHNRQPSTSFESELHTGLTFDMRGVWK